MPRRGLVVLAVAAIALALLPVLQGFTGFPVFYLAFLATIMFWTAQATSWNLLSGYGGYFSFGQGAFFGVGAYTTAVLSGRHGFDLLATFPVSAAVSVALALAIGGVAFRLRSLRGEIFALLTLAVPFMLAPLARVNPAIDGGQGVVVPVPSYAELVGGFQDLVFLLSLGIAVLAVTIAYGAQHSRLGWALFSIRDAEDVAEGLGVPTFRYKMLAISLTGAIGGLAGSVFAVQVGFITVEGVFNLTVPLFVIVMSVLGGRAHWLGPALGALVVVLLRDRLATGGFEGWSLVILGLVLAGLVLAAPEGLMARLRIRPRATAGAFVVVVVALGVVGSWGAPLDWIAAGMTAGAAVAFLPVPRRRLMREEVRLTADEGVEAPADVEGRVRIERTAGAESTMLSTGSVAPAGAAAPRRVVIECVDVTRRFGGVRAVDGVSVAIHEGDLVGLVGPNGSGKTTLVNLISGAIRPTSGSITIEGRAIGRLPQHRVVHLGVARTYQIPRPFESMTVRDNVAVAIMFGRQPRSLTDARAAAQEHLDLVGLRDLAGARPEEINLHERQLLEIARALATRPRVLLLDEALAGLNPAELDAAATVIRRLHASGITIVLVEHLLRVVHQLATRVVVLDQGHRLADGEPTVVMRDPAVVRAYLGRRRDA